MTIKNSVTDVREKIAAAAIRAGRDIHDITLLAATKTIHPKGIQEVIDSGVTVMGENRAQELVDKYYKVGGVKWHFIGHLQTNKVKYIIDKVELIHSVDSLKLAQEINKQAGIISKVQDILIELNIANDEHKFGIPLSGFAGLLNDIAVLPNIRIRGIMTIPPLGMNRNELTNLFKTCNKVLIDTKRNLVDNDTNIIMDTLSMGMSADFELAIEAGANIVRIGSGIFGQRT